MAGCPMTAPPSSPSTFRRHTVRWPFDRWCVITTAQNELWDSSRSISLFASMLVHACLDGEVPVVSGTVYEVARACGWMVARAAGRPGRGAPPRLDRRVAGRRGSGGAPPGG